MQKTEQRPVGLALLREPFPAYQISKLPKETKAQTDQRKANSAFAIKCDICGGWHHRNAVHLDYVGHAALTDRLLDVDPEWSWEPLAYSPDGLPLIDRNGGMWIRLRVLGVSRLGYGSADGKTGGDAVKELIGDALRNAAMRFGAALDLWHKGDLHASDTVEEESKAAAEAGLNPDQVTELRALAAEVGADVKKFCEHFKVESLADIPASQFARAVAAIEHKRTVAKRTVAKRAWEAAE